jgi:hypothetical protein
VSVDLKDWILLALYGLLIVVGSISATPRPDPKKPGR